MNSVTRFAPTRKKRREKWVSLRTNIDAPHGLAQLSDAAFRLYVSSVCYTVGQEWHHVPAGAVRMFLGRQSNKAIRELEDAGFWTPILGWGDSRAWMVEHEGTLWRAGRPLRQASIPRAVRAEVFERDGYSCVECGAEEFLTLDHIFPWSQGGEDDADNLRVLCRRCNSSKGAQIRGA